MNIENYLKQLETLVNIDCGSYNTSGIRQVSEYLSNWYEDINWYVKKHELEEDRVLLEISNHENCDHYDAMFLGHMDTVFPNGTVALRPFKRQEDKCFGPGVEDMKSGVLAMLHIAMNLPAKINDKLNICMCYNPDEEIGSKYSSDLLKTIASKADRVFVMESAQENGGHVFNRKGRTNYKLEFKGISCHAGFIFDVENASAIEELGKWINDLSKLKNKEKETTLNIGIISGGTSVNTVADKAYMELETRYYLEEERIRVTSYIENLIKNPFNDKVKINIIEKSEKKSWKQTKQGLEYIEHLKQIADKMNIPFNEKKRGGLSDANIIAEVCPIILDGMGPFGAYAHSEKEYMTISSVKPCVDFFIEVLNDLM